MKRAMVLAVLTSLALAGLVLAWSVLREDREFRRLISQGEASLAADRTFGAIEAFSGALALRPDSMLAYLKRGDTYRQRGELNSALRDLREAASLDATATRPRELLGDVNAAMGRHERAAEHYRSFIAIDDRSPRVLYKLALAHYRSRQAGPAIEALRQAVAIDDRFADAYHLLGLCLREQGREDDALRSLQRAVDVNPGLAAAREELADLLAAMGRTRDGIEQLEALAAIEPTRAERLVSVGLAYARVGRTDLAITSLGRAAERYPQEPIVYTALGRVWLTMAESNSDSSALRKSIEALQPAAARAMATSETLSLYGRALLLSGDADGAMRASSQAVERFPVDPAAFATLAAAAQKLGRLAVARDALVAYTTLMNDESGDRLATQIADLSLRAGDGASALPWARRAATHESADGFALSLLADALWRTGQHDAAREALARALALRPRHPYAERLRRRLER